MIITLLGLCSGCSDKLNYHSKKREIKRIKKRNKNCKHKNDINDSIDVPSTSSSSSKAENTTNAESSLKETAECIQTHKIDGAHQQLEQIFWNKSTNEEEKTREEEFDDYLADLLL